MSVEIPSIRPMPYHERLRDYLKAQEPELWKWFSSRTFQAEYADNVRLEILKSAYRLDRAAHGALYEQADNVLRRLGLTVPATIYQSQVETNLNAALSYLPGEAHVVFSGPVFEKLSPPELAWVLGHELSHYLLLQGWGGEFLVADQILFAMATHRSAEPSHVESCRLYRLYTEIFADRGALAVIGDPKAGVSSLVKLQTGLVQVDAESYLRQADEIFSKETVRTQELSHPETFVRARAIRLWSERGAEAEPEIARMIEGARTLDGLDLLAQAALTDATRRLLSAHLAMPALRSELLRAHARHFFDDFDPGAPAVPLPEEFRSAHATIQEYAGYVLLDFAVADPEIREEALAAAVVTSRKLGIEDAFLAAAGKALGLKKRALEKLRAGSEAVVAKANGGGAS